MPKMKYKIDDWVHPINSHPQLRAPLFRSDVCKILEAYSNNTYLVQYIQECVNKPETILREDQIESGPTSLKEMMKKDLMLDESWFSNHCSDLHIRNNCVASDKDGHVTAYSWLKKNFRYFSNVVRYTSNVEGQSYGKSYVEVPFAYYEYHEKGIVVK